MKAAVAIAVNRGQALVRESDLLEAEKQYSQYALESILVENGLSVPSLESVLYEFAGSPQFLSEPELERILTNAQVPKVNQPQVTEHLCSLAFLGIQVRPGDFRFAEDPPEQKRNVALAKQSLPQGGALKYKIHPAFCTFLEIQEG